jgi:hypothetical protein
MDFKIKQTLSDYKKFLNDVAPYNSLQEKNATLLGLRDDKLSALDLCKILNISAKNEIEAMALIFKARYVSVSEYIDYTHKCEKCSYNMTGSYKIDDLFFKEVPDESVPIGLFENVEDILTKEDLSQIDIIEYNKIELMIYNNNFKIFNPEYSIKCIKCENIDKRTFFPKDIVSAYDIQSIYNQYMDLSYFSSITKNDVDTMLPFEREVFVGLLQTREKEKLEMIKQQNQQNQNKYGARMY